MLLITSAVCVNGCYVMTYNDGTTSSHSPEELAIALRAKKVSTLEVDLDEVQFQEGRAYATSRGEAIDDFIESAIVEKLLRDASARSR